MYVFHWFWRCRALNTACIVDLRNENVSISIGWRMSCVCILLVLEGSVTKTITLCSRSFEMCAFPLVLSMHMRISNGSDNDFVKLFDFLNGKALICRNEPFSI